MEDNDKRNSSLPSVSSGNSPDSKPDMFDQHEATLPRFTIDPSDAAPRQRTRTLLGVPSMVSDEPAVTTERAPAPPVGAATPTTALPPERAETTLASGSLASVIVDAADMRPAAQAEVIESPNSLDMTIEVVEDELNDVTMVSDADVVALPDNTGQLQPVRFEAEPVTTTATKTEPVAFAATAPHPNSLSPREISRPAGGPPNREAPSGRWGALLVAAVMLLATGAWFLTAGTFRRATLSNAESTTAAATQPASEKTDKVAPAAQPQPPSEAPSPAADAVVAAAAPAAAPAPTPTTANAAAPASEDNAAPGTGLKNKPALTATMRGERVKRGAKGKAAPAPAPTGDAPQGPSRSEVISRLESVRPAVNACAAGRSGVADLDITIAHTGVVMHVLVGGDFAGTTEGSCIARAVRGARFQTFKQERFRLLYPYAI